MQDPRYDVPRAAEWTAHFAHEHIQSGDISFPPRPFLCTLRGELTSIVLAGVNDGRFSHVAMACWEGDELWIYDVEIRGVARKVPFVLWMLDVQGDSFAIKRLIPEHRHRIPKAIAFCDDAYQRHVQFDFKLSLDDDRYYCTEMVEKSLLSTGLSLSEPVQICRLPGYRRYRALVPFVELYLRINVHTPVFAVGNEHYGTFSSQHLKLVYEGPELDKPERGKPELEVAESGVEAGTEL